MKVLFVSDLTLLLFSITERYNVVITWYVGIPDCLRRLFFLVVNRRFDRVRRSHYQGADDRRVEFTFCYTLLTTDVLS